MIVMTIDGLHDFITSGHTLQTWLNGLTCRLYQNVVVIDPTRVTTDFIESTFPGYAAVAFTTWSPPVNDANNNQILQHGEIDFTSSGPASENVVGVFVTNAGGKTCFCEANAAPFPIPASGIVFAVFPFFYAGQIVPPL